MTRMGHPAPQAGEGDLDSGKQGGHLDIIWSEALCSLEKQAGGWARPRPTALLWWGCLRTYIPWA